MIVINNLKELEFIWMNEVMNKSLYEYIKNIIHKCNEVMQRSELVIIIEGEINEKLDYKLKWERESCINGIKYKEKFFINRDKGILLINYLM